MKKIALGALAITAALAATPAFAGTHVSIGLFAPAPVQYYEPAPVAYYPPVNHVYYAPASAYYVNYQDRGRGRGHGHDKHYAHWGQPRYYGWR